MQLATAPATFLSEDEMSKPRITVVILNWNRKDDLRDCLNSIKRQTYRDVEVIVADNRSRDGSQAMLAAEFPGVRLIQMPRNVGVAGSNAAMKVARGEFVVLIDNDMILIEEDAFEKVVKRFENRAEMGSLAFRVVDANSNQVSYNSPKYSEGDEKIGYEASAFDGGGVAIRRSVLEEVGYSPEEFFIYQNEIDLSTKIWAGGWEIRYFPDITVVHKFSMTSRPPRLFYYLWHRNYMWYFWKYFPALYAVRETARFITLGAMDSLADEYEGTWLRAVLMAFVGLPKILRRRRAVPLEVVRKIQRIRDEDYIRKTDGRTDGRTTRRLLDRYARRHSR